MTPIAAEARAVLARAVVTGNIVTLTEQLDRKLYLQVNDILARLGGKWDRRAKGHVFPVPAKDLISAVLADGQMPAKNPLAFYATPVPVIWRMLHEFAAVDLLPDDAAILEPSAGLGAIVDAIRDAGVTCTIDAVELDHLRATALQSHDCSVYEADFITWHAPRRYDLVVMNPPFATLEDHHAYISHIRRAWNHVKLGGKLVAIAPAGVTFRQDKVIAWFREWVQSFGGWEELGADAFRDAGTGISAVILYMDKPDDPPVSPPQPATAPTLFPMEAAMRQSQMFQYEDLPLFTGQPVAAPAPAAPPAIEGRQGRLGRCPICLDTGTVKVDGKVRCCPCRVDGA